MEENRLSNNTSQERGWLTPVRESPVYGEELDRLLSRWLRGVSDLPESVVRPRWQSEQPALLPPETNWCAFGVVDMPGDDNPAFVNQTEDNTELWRHETIECLASFYGPAGQQYATRFRDGITVSQNNAELNTLGLSLAGYSHIIPFPELINNQWVRRYDFTVRLRRKVVREYNIKSLVAESPTDIPVSFSGE
ncbi:hypothetical protein GPZ85_0011995 [Serratia symbiotica]|nr:hypothetical protein [Serratia symbiotica]MBQ0956480.1 hypothetical protein [Serratia symbiotica]